MEIIKFEEFGIEETKANELTSGLETILAEREVLKEAYLDVINLEITKENLPTFKELRLKIVKNRTQGIENWHKTQKAFFLTGGRFVDAIKNKESAVNQDWESKLFEAEKHFENLEKQKIAELQAERLILIEPYLENTFGLDLGIMSEEMFDSFLIGSKAKFVANQELLRIEAERLENERLAEIERQKAIKEENERLKKEAEENAKKQEAERLKREKLAKIEADNLAKERAENEAKLKAIQLEADKKQAIETAKMVAIQQELHAKKQAELKAENERIAKQKEAEKLAKAPIKKQMSVWVDSFSHSEITENETSKLILEKFESFKKWAKLEIEKM